MEALERSALKSLARRFDYTGYVFTTRTTKYIYPIAAMRVESQKLAKAIQECFGGRVYLRRAEPPGRKQWYEVRWFNRYAVDLLLKLIPYLRLYAASANAAVIMSKKVPWRRLEYAEEIRSLRKTRFDG